MIRAVAAPCRWSIAAVVDELGESIAWRRLRTKHPGKVKSAWITLNMVLR